MTDAEIRAWKRAQDYARGWARRLTLYNTPSRMVVWYDDLWTDLRFEEEAHHWDGGFRDVIGPIRKPRR